MNKDLSYLLIILVFLPLLSGCGENIEGQQKSYPQVAIYNQVDGVCFSLDGTRYGEYPHHLKREIPVKSTGPLLEKLIRELDAQGFFTEEDVAPKFVPFPPITHKICVRTEKKERTRTFWYCKDYGVPEKYLVILEALAPDNCPDIFKKFLDDNRKLER
ncbi:MAG: hypothetical protein HQL31_03795 [Planctomycetes bacterium]|nr:hypothetical protein [Planctomycetota bacterium]